VDRNLPRALLDDERIGAGAALPQLREHAALTRVVEGVGPGKLQHPGGHVELPANYRFHTGPPLDAPARWLGSRPLCLPMHCSTAPQLAADTAPPMPVSGRITTEKDLPDFGKEELASIQVPAAFRYVGRRKMNPPTASEATP